MLYIVSTPIGHLDDISFRAVQTLKDVDLIAAEDTRHTQNLTKRYGITTPLISYFEHNQEKRSEQIVKKMVLGQNVALVSDAGTPGINDPGYRLVQKSLEAGIPVTVIPGATALIAALSLSGLPTDRFVFEGFVPVKTSQRKKKYQSLAHEDRTVIFYESPHRIFKSLGDLASSLNDPYIVIAREITKKYEECLRGKASDLQEHFRHKTPRGEFVLLFNLKHQPPAQ